jgi:ubiquinone/menaquinone biosynthesis C-methylase UbiE
LEKAEIAEGGRVLDIGTGMGWMAASLAKSGYVVTTIEEKEEFQDIGKGLAARLGLEDRIEFKVGDITKLYFERNYFDGVVAYDSLHHIQGVEKVVNVMIASCKKGGKVVIVELNERGMEIASEFLEGHAYDVVDPSAIFRRAGLDIQVFPGEIMDVYICKK